MESDRERFQSFRRGGAGAGQDSQVVSIEAFYHPDSGKHVVYWVDIQDAFPNIDNIVIMKEARVVSRARDTSGQVIEPRCINYHHNVALEVVSEVFSNGVGSTLSPPSSVSRSTTPELHMDRDPTNVHARTASTASSHLTVGNTHPNQAKSTLPVSLGDPNDLMLPFHTKNGSSDSSNEQGRNNNDPDNQQAQGQPRWTTSTAGGSHSGRKVAVSISSQGSSYIHSSQSNNASSPSNGRIIEIEDYTDTLNLSTTHSHSTKEYTVTHGYSDSNYSDFHNDLPTSTTGLHAPLTTTAATVVRVEQSNSSSQSRQFMQRMESAVQLFGHLLVKGHHEQALLVKKESESIKQEMTQYYESLQAEVIKNTTLQNQLKEMMVAEQQMTKRILDLQEAQLDTDKMMLILQQQALDRLALIHSKATAILTQTYELHEFPIPRLFIILPKEDITKRGKISTLFVQRFRLYFLCECGEHTRPVGGPPSSLSHDIHLARHEGYDLDRPNEFFRKYGSYVLALLQMLKYGVAAAGMVVPPLNNLKVADGLEYVEEGLKAIEKGLAPRVDSAIEYLQGLTAAQDGVSKDLGDASSTSTLMDPVSISRLEGLEGADLRHLGSFLKASDEGKVLGNLYRTVTPKGHVKWVCLDHYRESYGAAALQEFKETVELNGGTYDQRTGRVTMRLASPILARQFYTMLLSTRLVHELELTLDWNTAFEDLRTLKGVMQQSNVFHLSLDLRGKTGPTSDFVYRNRRAEPIVQIMAGGKVHTMTLKNTTGFLLQTKELLKTTLHVRHFDLGEMIGTADDFFKLEKLIRASPTLLRLGVVVGDIDGAFARLKPLVARHKALSILDLALRDGTAASVRFEQGSDKIRAIELKIVAKNAAKLLQIPMAISVSFLTKNTTYQALDLLHTATEEQALLKVVELVQSVDGSAAWILQDLQRAIDVYTPETETQVAMEEDEVFMEEIPIVEVADLEVSMSGSMFSVLDLIHGRSLLCDAVLIIASMDEMEQILDGTVREAAPTIGINTRRTIFALRGEASFLASIRLELHEGRTNLVSLFTSDFDSREAFQHTCPYTLTMLGSGGYQLLKELALEWSTIFSKLRTLEFGFMPGDLFDILMYVQQVASQYPTLSRLNLWNFTDKTMRGFDLPLRDLNLLDQSLSVMQLRTLLHAAPILSRVMLSIPSISEAFEVVDSTAKLHKQLSRAVLVAKKSRLSAQFAVGTGTVESITLRIHEYELGPLLKLPNVTELDLGFVMDQTRIKQIADSVLSQYRHLQIFKLGHGFGQLLPVVNILNQAAIRHSAECRVVLVELDVDSPRRKERVLELPLKALDIASYEINYDDLAEMQDLVRVRPMLQELSVAVASIEVAERIYNLVVQERMSMETLSFRYQDATAEFSLEIGSEEGSVAVTQKVTHSELEDTFFLPKAGVQRVDVVGTEIYKPQAAEIATYVMRHCCDVGTIRFVDLPNEVHGVAAIIKDYIQYGSYIRLLERDLDRMDDDSFNINSNDSDDDSNTSSDAMVPASQGAGLAVYCVLEDDGTRDDTSSDREDNVRASSIIRIRQDGRLVAIGLDWTDPDGGVTLRLNSMAFDESDFARLADVTRMEVYIDRHSIKVNNLVRAPVKTFSDLKHLELFCAEPLLANVLLAALEAIGGHLSLAQLRIRSPESSSGEITFHLPLKSLDLTPHSFLPHENIVMERILASDLTITELVLNVSTLYSAFKFVCSNVKKLRSLSRLRLFDRVGSILSISLKPGRASEMKSALLISAELQGQALEDRLSVAMLHLSDTTLELLGAIQEATVDNPGFQGLGLVSWRGNTIFTIEAPFRKFRLGQQLVSLEQIGLLRQLPTMLPLLSELQLAVASVPDFNKAIRILGPVFKVFKRSPILRLRLRHGGEASILFSEDGALQSVGLRIPEECSEELGKIRMVKEVTICPKDATLWRDTKYAKEGLTKVLDLFPKTITLQLDCVVDDPCPILLFFRDKQQKSQWLQLRRFRYRETQSSPDLTTHIIHKISLWGY